jgi:hypothetical protein
MEEAVPGAVAIDLPVDNCSGEDGLMADPLVGGAVLLSPAMCLGLRIVTVHDVSPSSSFSTDH